MVALALLCCQAYIDCNTGTSPALHAQLVAFKAAVGTTAVSPPQTERAQTGASGSSSGAGTSYSDTGTDAPTPDGALAESTAAQLEVEVRFTSDFPEAPPVVRLVKPRIQPRSADGTSVLVMVPLLLPSPHSLCSLLVQVACCGCRSCALLCGSTSARRSTLRVWRHTSGRLPRDESHAQPGVAPTVE